MWRVIGGSRLFPNINSAFWLVRMQNSSHCATIIAYEYVQKRQTCFLDACAIRDFTCGEQQPALASVGKSWRERPKIWTKRSMARSGDFASFDPFSGLCDSPTDRRMRAKNRAPKLLALTLADS